MGSSGDNFRGVALAVTSCMFIGASYVIKKIGLKRSALSGLRAGMGGHAYLKEPFWWLGLITMILGEIANFVAYAFAPAILVTPLGALSIIVSAVLAHFVLHEKLHMFGIVGCILCIVGSAIIALHAPEEVDLQSVKEVWHLAFQPGFIAYICVVLGVVVVLIFKLSPKYGQRNMLVYIGICSLTGSLTVMSVKAVSIALKLSVYGHNQFMYFQTWFFIVVVVIFVVMQLNYLNKALDTFNTAIVSPVYYVMFTVLTVLASMIMLKEWELMTLNQVATEFFGFVVIIMGTFLLHKTKDMVEPPTPELSHLTEPHHTPESIHSLHSLDSIHSETKQSPRSNRVSP